MEPDHLPKDLELSPAAAEEGGMNSFLYRQVCHGLPNSCPKKSKSGVIDHKHLKVTHASLVYVLRGVHNRVLVYGRVWQICGLVGHKCGEG